MKMRRTEMYNVEFANTVRLKKASVITMQNYLNNDAIEIRKRNVGWDIHVLVNYSFLSDIDCRLKSLNKPIYLSIYDIILICQMFNTILRRILLLLRLLLSYSVTIYSRSRVLWGNHAGWWYKAAKTQKQGPLKMP